MRAISSVLVLSLLVLGVQSQACPKPGDVFINTGGPNLADGIRCDTGTYSSKGSLNYAVPTQNIGMNGCTAYYFSHRYQVSGDLVYKIPVNAGAYVVSTFFMETYHSQPNKRVFNILINGKPPIGGSRTDVVGITGGKLKPLQRNAFNVIANAANDNTITVTLQRTKIGDPMISAISVSGINASAKVGNNGLGSCASSGNTGIDVGGEGGDGVPDGSDVSSGPGVVVLGNKLPCPGPNSLFINAGGKNMNGYRCDVLAFSKSKKYAITPPSNLGGKCSSHMWSHGYTFGQSLDYNIKVPSGKYSYQLHFMETFFNSAEKRKFSITVNGKLTHPALDVFAAAKGRNKPFVISGTVVAGSNGISIKLGRLSNADNPMISGITISGENPTELIGNLGLNSCTADSPDKNGNDDGSCPSDFAGDHFAHAVTGGPYVETDFKRQGFATVFLDGSSSHSHADSINVSGRITKHIWSWEDKGNPSSNSQGVVTKTGAKVSALFPAGTTKAKLVVTDNFGNCAEETTNVTVQQATKPGAYCYYYDFGNSQPSIVPLPFSAAVGPKPIYAMNVGDINFGNLASFGNFKFKGNSFAIRCVYQILVNQSATLTYDVVHSGPVKAYQGNQLMAQSNGFGLKKTSTKAKFYTKGLHEWQLLYFHKEFSPAQLKFQFNNGGIVPATIVRHDASTTLPVITGISQTSGFAGQAVTLFGLAFVNGVRVKFGDVIAQPVSSSAGVIELTVPVPQPGVEVVDVVIETEAGESNPVKFMYGSEDTFCQRPQWESTSLKNSAGTKDFEIDHLAVIKYGPDGRLYAGSRFSLIHAFTLNQQLRVMNVCTKNVKGTYPRRWILGIAFNPKFHKRTMFFSSSTIGWHTKPYKLNPFNKAWQNGKVQAVDMVGGANGCFGVVRDVVSGLPVGSSDHGVNWLNFLPDGQLLISIAGTTNGGVSLKTDRFGGIVESPLSGSIISCPTNTNTVIKYTTPFNPATTKANMGGCKMFAPGFRNSFGAELHTNGWLYATDNSPNVNYGSFSTNCLGGQMVDRDMPDRFLKVQPGKCHGHPNLNRGKLGDPKQCVFRSKSCAGSLWNFQPSTNGVLEYRSNVFDGAFKTHVLLSRFSQAIGSKGTVARVILNDQGNIQTNGVNNVFFEDSGVSIVEGPRGEVIMSRVAKKSLLVYRPICTGTPKGTYLIGVHPKRGSALGGQRVLISGFNFGKNPTAFFGSKPCTETQVLNTQAFYCKTPSGTANTQVAVKVVDESGSENMQETAALGGDFWYW